MNPQTTSGTEANEAFGSLYPVGDIPVSADFQKQATQKAIAEEDKFIDKFTNWSGATPAQARNMCIYSDIIQNRDPYCYHFQ
jgi:hypothetical protein